MRPLMLVVVLAALLAIPATAGAGPAVARRFTDRGTFTDVDPDFCGTGEEIAIAGRFNFNVWVGESGGAPDQELKTAFNFSNTFTNPDNGKSVIESFAGSNTNEVVVGLESGAHTHRFVENGLRAKLKLAHGRVLTVDAGQIVYDASFDEKGEFVGVEVISVHGPHPAFDSDVWCDAATKALGIG